MLALWSPDGRRLAVVLTPTPLVDDDLMRRRVHVVDVESGRVEANLDDPGSLDTVAWSPDGRHIAIVTAEDLNDPAAGRLWVRAVAGGAWKDVLPSYMGHVGDLAWTGPEAIAFVGNEDVETTIGEVRADGSGRRTRVADGGKIVTAIAAARPAQSRWRPNRRVTRSEVFTLAAGATAPNG